MQARSLYACMMGGWRCMPSKHVEELVLRATAATPVAVNRLPAFLRAPQQALQTCNYSVELFNEKQLTGYLSHETSVPKLLSLLEDHHKIVNPIHVATAFCQLAKIAKVDPRKKSLPAEDALVLFALQKKLKPLLQDCTADTLISCLWALAKVNSMPRIMNQMLELLSVNAGAELSTVSPRNLVNLVWSLAKFSDRPPQAHALFDRATDLLYPRLNRLPVQQLSMLLWSAAMLDVNQPTLVQHIVDMSQPQLASFKPKDLSTLMWALATMNHNPDKKKGSSEPQFMDAVADVIMAGANSLVFKPYDLAMITWAIALLGCTNRDMMRALVQASVPQMHDFLPMDIGQVLYGFARLGYKNDLLFSALLERAAPVLNSFKEPEFVNLIWSCARVGFQPSHEFLEQSSLVALRHCRRYSPMQLAKLIWSYVTLDYCPDLFMQKALDAASMQMLEISPVAIPKLLVSAGMLSKKYPDHNEAVHFLLSESVPVVMGIMDRPLHDRSKGDTTGPSMATEVEDVSQGLGAARREQRHPGGVFGFTSGGLKSTLEGYSAAGYRNDELYAKSKMYIQDNSNMINPDDLPFIKSYIQTLKLEPLEMKHVPPPTEANAKPLHG